MTVVKKIVVHRQIDKSFEIYLALYQGFREQTKQPMFTNSFQETFLI
jgi:type I site-specific restriction endonuclease